MAFRGNEDVTLTTVNPLLEDDEPSAGVTPQLIVLSGSNVGLVYRLGDEAVTLGRDAEATIRLDDPGVSRGHARVEPVDDGQWRLCDTGSRNGTFANGEPVVEGRILQDGDRIQVGTTTVIKFSWADNVETRYAEAMYDAALRDSLTGVYNRRYFDERLETEFRHIGRHRRDLALLLLDLDHFKRINDQYGHLAGDVVLKDFCRMMATTIRSEDVLARYGGEEFAVLCRETNLARASILAERARHRCADAEFRVDDKRIDVTVSIGLAACPNKAIDSAERLVSAADEALYRAKEQGRNCVVVWR